MEKVKEASKYFKENKGYVRLFKALKNKYVSLGEIKGNVTITNPEELEKQALSGLMKKDYSKNRSINISLKRLQEVIDESKFSGAKLKDIIEDYFKEEILTKKEKKKIYDEGIELFFARVLEKNKDEDVYEYLEEIVQAKNDVYVFLKQHYNKDSKELEEALIHACNAINNLPEDKMRIPVFASKITKNPHSLDKSTLCGKIFVMLLCYINQISKPQTTEEFAEVYYKNNLLIDDVSNMVLCKNVIGFQKIYQSQEGTGYERHEGLVAFAQYGEPIYLNLYNLSNIGFLEEYHDYNEVIVMENPAVFMEVSEKINKKDIPMVCTYGQVKLAGIVLLDMFIEQGYTIYYSGDIDPEGIQIADKLKQRYGESLEFIGFDLDTYYRNLSNVELADSRLVKLDKIKSKKLQEIANEVKKKKRQVMRRGIYKK